MSALFTRVGSQIFAEQPETRSETLVRDFEAQVDAYYASPNTSFYDDKLLRRFYEQKLRHLGFKPYPADGLVTYGASGTNLCDRQLVFKNAKVKTAKSDDIPFRGRQRRIGNAVVDYLQLDIVHMPKRLGDAAKFTIPTNEAGDWTFEDASQLRTVFEHNVSGVKFAITAKPDGLMRYADGTDVILEFKTKASGLRAMNSKLDYKGAQDDHIRQVTAESLVFGVREALIVYESTHKPSWNDDTDNSAVTKGQKTWENGAPRKDIRAFYVYVTDEMQEVLLTDLARQSALVYAAQSGEAGVPDVTPEMTGSCAFCAFRDHCHATIGNDNLAQLRRIEGAMAASQMAGKSEHRRLQEYLAEVGV